MQWLFGPFRLDMVTAELWRAEQRVPLRPKTLDILAYLVAHAGQLVTKAALLESLWAETAVSEGVLKTSMNELRKTLGETAKAPRWIATVHRRGYRFVAPVTRVEDAVSPAATRALTPALLLSTVHGGPVAPPPYLVAREAEVATLHQWFAKALQGERHLGFITGEAGMGKTTLVDAFVAQLAGQTPLWVGRGQCIEQYGAGEAYLPLLEALGQMGRGPDGSHLMALLRQQAPSWLLQMPAFLAQAEYEELQRYTGGSTRERMLRELAEAMEGLTAARPCILVLEDLHWSDTATIEWLAYVARRRGPARLLVLGTYRPVEAIMRAHPVRAAVQELLMHSQGTELPLEAWSEAGVAAYLVQRGSGEALPDGFVRVLSQRTDGHPLFVVALVDELLRQGLVQVGPAGWTLTGELDTMTLGVPQSIRHLLEHQVTHLGPVVQEILEAASVAGMEFTVAAVAAGSGQAEEDVEAQCDTLARRQQVVQGQGTVVWPDGTVTARYGFRHALYQELLYEQVLVRRRVRWHQQIGMRLEAGYGNRASELAAELAMHFERGQELRRAVQYLQQAADNAMRRYAPQEAIAHLHRGLELLTTLPDTSERSQQALTLHLALGVPLVATRGYAAPEVEQTYNRARQLCQQVGDTARLFYVLRGLWGGALVRAELVRAQALVKELFSVAQRQPEPELLVEAHRAMGTTLFFLGEPASALPHLQQARAVYQATQHVSLTVLYGVDPGITCQLYAASTLWLLGYAEQAQQSLHAAVLQAQNRAHPLSLAFALNHAANFYQRWREPVPAREWAEAAMAVSRAQGLPFFLAWSTVMLGWALAEQGQEEAGMAQLYEGLAAWRATGTELIRPYVLTVLAEVYGKCAQATAGLRTLAEAWVAVDRTAERWWEAEMYRLKGELLQQVTDDEAQAAWAPEACLQQALDIARRQQAKTLELRAAMSLGRLWQQQGKQAEARQLLVQVYDWFTEGFDTVDLQEARTLLTTLGE